MNSFSARRFGFIIKKLVFGFLFDFCFSFILFFFSIVTVKVLAL